MYKFKSLNDYAVRASVRLEGTVNQMWTLHLKDGSKAEYYAYEGSPQRESDDKRVYDYDEQLALFLDKLVSLEPLAVRDDEDNQVIEYDVHFALSYIDEVKMANAPDDVKPVPSEGFIWRYDGRYFNTNLDRYDSTYGFTRREYHSIKEVKLEGGKLVINGSDNGSSDPADILHELHIRFRPVIMEFLVEFNKSMKYPVEDWNEYEGGVDDWWGMGSVSMHELGMVFTMQWRSCEYTLTVE